MTQSHEKHCHKCNQTKPLTAKYWQRNRAMSDGFMTQCKSCRHEYDRQRDQVRNKRLPRRIMQAVSSANHKARELGLLGRLTDDDIRAKLTAQKRRCYWCKDPLIVPLNFEIDHIVAFVLGGSNTPENVCVSCPDCNQHKGDKTVKQWLGELAKRGILHELTPDEFLLQMSLFDQPTRPPAETMTA